mgnify:CR=1 FL=1
MAAVPPLVQLDHRGPQEAAVGVKFPSFPGRPKTTPADEFRGVVRELRDLGMPDVTCDSLLGLINQDPDADLSTDSNCLELVTCEPENARMLLLDKFWAPNLRFNLGNAQRSREDLRKLRSKLLTLAQAMDKNWWDWRTDHLTKIVVDEGQRAKVRATLQGWSSMAMELVLVLDATVDLAQWEERGIKLQAGLEMAEHKKSHNEQALQTVKNAYEPEMEQERAYIKEQRIFQQTSQEAVAKSQANLQARQNAIDQAAEAVRNADAGVTRAKTARDNAKRDTDARSTTEAAELAGYRRGAETGASATETATDADAADNARADAVAAADKLFDTAPDTGAVDSEGEGGSDSGSEFSGDESDDAAATGRQLRDVMGRAVQRM